MLKCQRIFAILLLSHLRKGRLLICRNLNPLHSNLLCAKFGWNWPSGSRENEKMWKVYKHDRQPDEQATGDHMQVFSSRLPYLLGYWQPRREMLSIGLSRLKFLEFVLIELVLEPSSALET